MTKILKINFSLEKYPLKSMEEPPFYSLEKG